MSKPLKTVNYDVLSKLSLLQEPGEPDFVTELINIFFISSAESLTVLQEALKKQDLPMIKKTAHKLKSSAANLGAEQMTEYCQNLEIVELAKVHPLVHALVNEFEQVKGELAKKKVA